MVKKIIFLYVCYFQVVTRHKAQNLLRILLLILSKHTLKKNSQLHKTNLFTLFSYILKIPLDPHVALCRMIDFTKGNDMKTWQVKEFARLAKISVRTLHHYDEIGLLKPSLRTESSYRIYSELDLQRLERIMALKFFGFNLKQITAFIGKDEDLLHHLKAQQTCLALKIEQLHAAKATINELLAASANKPVNWSKIVQLIEVYTMADYLKQDWVVQTFSPKQLQLLTALDKKFTEAEKDAFENAWNMLFNQTSKLVTTDPTSPEAQELAKNWMDLLQENYQGSKELIDTISMAYKHNKLPHRPFNQKLWDFIEAAIKHMQKKNK